MQCIYYDDVEKGLNNFFGIFEKINERKCLLLLYLQ